MQCDWLIRLSSRSKIRMSSIWKVLKSISQNEKGVSQGAIMKRVRLFRKIRSQTSSKGYSIVNSYLGRANG